MRCWLLLLWLALPAPSWAAACKLTALEMPVTVSEGRAVTKVGINGTDVKLMVDSGAFFSFLTHATAEQLQLKTGYLPFGMEVRGLTGEVDARMTRGTSTKPCARVRLRQGRDREAVADYDRALKIRPDSPWSLFGRGIARLRQGERVQGEADLAAARQLQPSIDLEAARHGIAPPSP